MNALFAPRNANPAAPVAPTTPNEKWRKDAFLNFSLPDGNGGQAKLGSIGLQMSNVRQRKLMLWLTADDGVHLETRLRILVSQLVVELRSSQPDESAGFALPDTL